MAAYSVQLLWSNNATTTLAGSINNSAVTANLATGTGALFPAPAAGQGFTGTFTDLATGLIHEIVLVTGRTGDTITMVRGQEGTSPASWTANDLFGNLWTRGAAETLVQAYQLQQQSGNYADDTGATNAYVVGLAPTISVAPPAGTVVRVKIKSGGTNTGAATLNAGWGATTVRRRDGTTLRGGEIVGARISQFLWNESGQFEWQGLAPATDVDAVAGTDTQSAITPAQLSNASLAPPGTMVPSLALTTPTGWLACNGAAVNRTTFANLFAAITAAATVTITIASPGVVTWNSHGLVAGDLVSFETTGALPTGIVTGTNYYVVAPTTNTFEVAATPAGAAINTTGSQSGVQTARHNPAGCGNGTTTFTLPDGRGRAFFGWDPGGSRLTSVGLGGNLNAVVGATGGTQTESTSAAGTTSGSLTVSGNTDFDANSLGVATGGADGVSHPHAHTITNLPTSGSLTVAATTATVTNVPPALVGYWIIKT